MLNNRAGLIVSDTKNSAISTSSRMWADKLNANIVYALEFPTLAKLIKAISLNYSWVFFTWRGSLEMILKDKYLTSQLNELSKEMVLFFSVPDHIDLSIAGNVNSNPIYEYADGFTVVSRRLQNSYAELQHIAVTPFYLPDFPNTKLVQDIREMNLPKSKNSVIWVGNSRWGESLGFQDHKGYVSKFRRIIELSVKRSIPLTFKVIDRGKSFVPHRETLMEIAKSSFLLQTSASEGTGLPVLEALAFGTFPLTTDVGINRELFGVRWQEYHASTPEEFLDKISSSYNSSDASALEGIYSHYLTQCSQIIANFKFPIKEPFSEIDERRKKYLGELGIDLMGRVQWPVRFLLNKLRTMSIKVNEESCK